MLISMRELFAFGLSSLHHDLTLKNEFHFKDEREETKKNVDTYFARR